LVPPAVKVAPWLVPPTTTRAAPVPAAVTVRPTLLPAPAIVPPVSLMTIGDDGVEAARLSLTAPRLVVVAGCSGVPTGYRQSRVKTFEPTRQAMIQRLAGRVAGPRVVRTPFWAEIVAPLRRSRST